MSSTGTYVYREGVGVVKVSDRIPIIKKTPEWARRMDPVGEQQRQTNAMTPQQLAEESAAA